MVEEGCKGAQAGVGTPMGQHGQPCLRFGEPANEGRLDGVSRVEGLELDDHIGVSDGMHVAKPVNMMDERLARACKADDGSAAIFVKRFEANDAGVDDGHHRRGDANWSASGDESARMVIITRRRRFSGANGIHGLMIASLS
jgi:hypothetical protein